MSKPTFSSAFRRVDVDEFSDEKFKDDEAENASSTNGSLSPEIGGGPSETDVLSFLSQGKPYEALQYILNTPPVKTKDQSVKNGIVQLVVKVLVTFRSSADIEEVVSSLSPAHLDVLMKYIYRGFEFPTAEGSSAVLLVWHEKVFAVAGPGCIVRVLADQKRV